MINSINKHVRKAKLYQIRLVGDWSTKTIKNCSDEDLERRYNLVKQHIQRFEYKKKGKTRIEVVIEENHMDFLIEVGRILGAKRADAVKKMIEACMDDPREFIKSYLAEGSKEYKAAVKTLSTNIQNEF